MKLSVLNSFINIKGCSSNCINRNLIQQPKKTMIHIDSSQFHWLDKQGRNVCIKLRTHLYNPFSSYIWIRNHFTGMSKAWAGVVPGLANARLQGSAKFANNPLLGLTVARGRGGEEWEGHWAQLELNDAYWSTKRWLSSRPQLFKRWIALSSG